MRSEDYACFPNRHGSFHATMIVGQFPGHHPGLPPTAVGRNAPSRVLTTAGAAGRLIGKQPEREVPNMPVIVRAAWAPQQVDGPTGREVPLRAGGMSAVPDRYFRRGLIPPGARAMPVVAFSTQPSGPTLTP